MSGDTAVERKALRLRGFDYRTACAYFVTVCTHSRAAWFGRVGDGVMALSAAGEIVQAVWGEIPQHFAHVGLDEFVVMPNHAHGILWTIEPEERAATDVGAQHAAPLRTIPKVTPGSLGAIVRLNRPAQGASMK